MSEHDNVRIGFVGVGMMGQCAHLRNYATLPDCRVVAVSELRQKTARMVAERYGIPAVYADYRQMLEREKLDGIVAVQRFECHGLLVPELARAGIPLFIEKPLARSLAAGESILRALADSGTIVMVGYHKRCDPATQYAQREIELARNSGELGKMRYLRITAPDGEWICNGFAGVLDGGDERATAQSDAPETGLDARALGIHWDFVNGRIHQLNMARHLLGETFDVTYADPAGIVLGGRSKSGVPVTMEFSPYRACADWQERALVGFDRGYVRLGVPAPLAVNRPGWVEVLKEGAKGSPPLQIRPHLPWADAMRQQAQTFLKVVRGEMSPPSDAADAMEDLRVARKYIQLLTGQ